MLEGFGADVGGEELGVAAFEAEVGGGGVAVELVGAGYDVAVDGGHAVVVVLGCLRDLGEGINHVRESRPFGRLRAGYGRAAAKGEKSSSQSKPHSRGRTMRLVSRVVSAVSHAYIHFA